MKYVRAPAFVLAVLLVFYYVLPVTAYAQISTVSDAQQRPDPPDDSFGGFGSDEFFLSQDDIDAGIAPYAAEYVPSVTNTINYSGMIVQMAYIDLDDNTVWVNGKVDSTGYVTISKPSDYKDIVYIQFILKSAALPQTGNYDFSLRITSNSGITWTNNTSINSFTYPDNASTISSVFSPNWDLDQIYQEIAPGGTTYFYNAPNYPNARLITHSFGELYCYYPNVGIVNNKYSTNDKIHFAFRCKNPSFTYGFSVKIAFRVAGTTTPEYQMVGTPPTSEDVQQDIADTVSGIAGSVNLISGAVNNIVSGIGDLGSKMSDMVKGVQELPGNIASAMEPHFDDILRQIQHITDQLHAFWDQLAAYFNDKLIPQMITDTDRIVEAIENIDLNVNVSMQELINALQKMHDEQLLADKENTDQITDGYDNSGLEDTNDKLQHSIDAYDDKEAELFGQVQDYVNDFEYKDPFKEFTAPLTDISYMLTGIYTGIGLFNIPIMFSLTLTIALICIGWYRMKGG